MYSKITEGEVTQKERFNQRNTRSFTAWHAAHNLTCAKKITMKYHHLGIPTKEKRKDEKHLPHLKLYVSGYGENPYGIEWIRFEEDAPYPELVKKVPHLAFEVDDIQAAIEGKKVIIAPNSPSPSVMVAFVEEKGAPIEFLEIDKSIAETGIQFIAA